MRVVIAALLGSITFTCLDVFSLDREFVLLYSDTASRNKNASCYMFSESQERIAVMKGKSLDDLTSLQSTQANTENIANYVKH